MHRWRKWLYATGLNPVESEDSHVGSTPTRCTKLIKTYRKVNILFIYHIIIMKYKYTKEQLEEIIKDVLSTAELLRKLNIRPAGGNYKTIKNYIKLYDIDISHFTGQGWNKGVRYRPVNKIKNIEDILIENSTYTNTSKLRIRLIKEGLKENKCEICDIEKWNNMPI